MALPIGAVTGSPAADSRSRCKPAVKNYFASLPGSEGAGDRVPEVAVHSDPSLRAATHQGTAHQPTLGPRHPAEPAELRMEGSGSSHLSLRVWGGAQASTQHPASTYKCSRDASDLRGHNSGSARPSGSRPGSAFEPPPPPGAPIQPSPSQHQGSKGLPGASDLRVARVPPKPRPQDMGLWSSGS